MRQTVINNIKKPGDPIENTSNQVRLARLSPKADFGIPMPDKKRGPSTTINQVRHTMENGKEGFEMAKAPKNGQMVPYMMATGNMAKPMVRARLPMLTETNTLVHGDMIKQMDLATTIKLME